MKVKKNRRTLKKRIRKVISLSTFITVVFLSGIFIYLVISASNRLAGSQAKYISTTIDQEMHSKYFLNALGIKSISDIDPKNVKTKEWFMELDREARAESIFPLFKDMNSTYFSIEIGGKTIYSNKDLKKPENPLYIQSTNNSTLPILNDKGTQIGSIAVEINQEYIFGIVASVLAIIIGISLIALFMSNILSRFLVIPVINPLKQLETKVRAIAEGDQDTAVNTHIIVKKPLREIESLANSTNQIMDKLKEYASILSRQKEELENQNCELEAQNEELVESKLQIQKQQGQLIQSEKMASVGQLTAAIAHEINTPIGAINSNAQVIELILGELSKNEAVLSNEELSASVNQIKETNDVNTLACKRITEIIKSLKTFSRLDQAEYQEADINEGLKSVLVLTHNLLKNRITIHTEYAELPKAKCFPGQLNQVFMNLIVNASQAIPDKGEIFIKTCLEDDNIYISIRDTGSGIKEENLSKIFDPGFTTKGVGIGLGLGLSISYNIIQKHNGDISVKSETGNGTEFTIRIPISNDRAIQ